MNAIHNLYIALKSAYVAAVEQYRFLRNMQRGGNPDVLPF